MCDDLVQIVDQKICVRRRFTISEISCEFPEISSTLLYEIINSLYKLWSGTHSNGFNNGKIITVVTEATCVRYTIVGNLGLELTM
jgi:hypothetical protein